MIEPSIFRQYDIRGAASGDQTMLTPAVATLIGRAFGTVVQREAGQRGVIVGRDNRISSAALAAAAVDGLRASGCAVIDIGTVSTPTLYWFAVQNDSGGLMVTGSHLAPDQNGFKLCIGRRSLYGADIAALRDLIDAGAFATGSGTLTTEPDAITTYMADLAARLPGTRSLRVVIDAGNGTASLIAAALVRRWGHDVIDCLYCESDGTYPNHQPDPTKLKNVADLSAAVRQHGADIGLAFDGDADRVGVVDEQGALIAPDRVLALLAQDLLTRHPGAVIVADVSSSQAVFDTVRQHGGSPLLWRTGHSFIKAKMAETGALLAGEVSGHIFLAEDYFGFDDGYFAAGRLLDLLGRRDQPLSALNDALPRLYSTPVYRPHCPPELMPGVLARVGEAFADHDIVTVDGLRISFAQGWAGVRTSNTEPVLSLRFEGATEADALAYREAVFAVLREFPAIDLTELD